MRRRYTQEPTSVSRNVALTVMVVLASISTEISGASVSSVSSQNNSVFQRNTVLYVNEANALPAENHLKSERPMHNQNVTLRTVARPGRQDQTFQRILHQNSLYPQHFTTIRQNADPGSPISDTAAASTELSYSGDLSRGSSLSPGSRFGTENLTVITTQVGATALMPCTVHQLEEGVVSWIRRKDHHLLTVALTTYSSDERFTTSHLGNSEDWTLQIKFVQQRDAGIYECQISTHPPTSIFAQLIVVEARAEIPGPQVRYLTPGSTLRLQCQVVQNTESSKYLFWYHDNRMINYDFDRGINVSTDSDFQLSELVITKTRREHSGNYTCVVSNTQPASVLVHIFKGDNPAAMYHGHVGSSQKQHHKLLPRICVALVVIILEASRRKCCVRNTYCSSL